MAAICVKGNLTFSSLGQSEIVGGHDFEGIDESTCRERLVELWSLVDYIHLPRTAFDRSTVGFARAKCDILGTGDTDNDTVSRCPIRRTTQSVELLENVEVAVVPGGCSCNGEDVLPDLALDFASHNRHFTEECVGLLIARVVDDFDGVLIHLEWSIEGKRVAKAAFCWSDIVFD